MKTLRIYSRLVKLEGGQSFYSYSLRKDKTSYNVKGTKDCFGLPREVGYFKVSVEDTNISLSHKGKYPTLWLKGSVTAVRDVDYEAKIEAEKKKEIDSIVNDQLFD